MIDHVCLILMFKWQRLIIFDFFLILELLSKGGKSSKKEKKMKIRRKRLLKFQNPEIFVMASTCLEFISEGNWFNKMKSLFRICIMSKEVLNLLSNSSIPLYCRGSRNSIWQLCRFFVLLENFQMIWWAC